MRSFTLKPHHVFARIMKQNEKRFWDLLRFSVRMATCLFHLVWSVEKCFLDIQPTILQLTAKGGFRLGSQVWFESACEWWMCQQMALIGRVRTNECRTTLWRNWRIRKDLQEESQEKGFLSHLIDHLFHLSLLIFTFFVICFLFFLFISVPLVIFILILLLPFVNIYLASFVFILFHFCKLHDDTGV